MIHDNDLWVILYDAVWSVPESSTPLDRPRQVIVGAPPGTPWGERWRVEIHHYPLTGEVDVQVNRSNRPATHATQERLPQYQARWALRVALAKLGAGVQDADGPTYE